MNKRLNAKLSRPHKFAGDSGVMDEEIDAVLDWYGEVYDKTGKLGTGEFFVALMTVHAYVVYHVISKLRGNEKNPQMNNFGISLALLLLVVYSVNFTNHATSSIIYDGWKNWYYGHENLYLWIYWVADCSYLLSHWFFNWRYVKSTFRLPVLQKSAEFFSEMLNRIIEQRGEQHVVFTAQELETHTSEMAKLKERQQNQELWSCTIERVFLLLVVASSYTYVYVYDNYIENYFILPMFLLLNTIMVIAVIVMRFLIKRTPNLLPNENLIIVHVFLFTAVTCVWIPYRVSVKHLNEAMDVYYADLTDANYLKWVLASGSYLKLEFIYNTVDICLSMFMLYMLHQFSIFTGFVTDPLTGQQIPVLSMFQTAKAMEKGM